MASEAYITNRKRYGRPQALLFSNNPGTVSNGVYVPDGTEMSLVDGVGFDYDFMVLTDNNRKELNLSVDRIQQRKRMVNGRSRAVHVADKLKLSTSWDMVPSRAFANAAAADAFYQDTGEEDYDTVNTASRYTTDGGAGGADMLRWYKDNPGNFWVFMAYDNFHNFEVEVNPHTWMTGYNERVEMYITDFSYDIVKRSALFDFWNVSLTLEEA